MSYERWTRHSDWYIYRQSGPQRREDEILNVWHVTSSPGQPNTEFHYDEVSEMLALNDLSRIRGWSPAEDDLLREALAAFIKDVDETPQGPAASKDR